MSYQLYDRLPFVVFLRCAELAEGREAREELLAVLGSTKEFREYAQDADLANLTIRLGYAAHAHGPSRSYVCSQC